MQTFYTAGVRPGLDTHTLRRRRTRGTMTVEFALAFPILIAIVFGLIDVGRFIATRVMLTQAAAAGARAACLSSSTTQAPVDQAVSDAATMLSGINVYNVDCLPAGPLCNWPKGTGAIVAVTVQYDFSTGFFSAFRKTMQNTSRVVCN